MFATGTDTDLLVAYLDIVALCVTPEHKSSEDRQAVVPTTVGHNSEILSESDTFKSEHSFGY